MNFSGISRKSLVGNMLRVLLRLLPEQTALPIVQGAFRGKRFVAGSGRHGYWLGSFEYYKRLVFEERVEPGDVVYDVGAHVGYYTLLASCLVEPDGMVVAFEPSPRNLRFLRRHIELNGLKNVTVVEGAVAETEAKSGFVEDDGRIASSQGSLVNGSGSYMVETTTIDHLVEAGFPPPDVIKIDVEGAESRVLEGARRTLAEKRPLIFLSTHGRAQREECFEYLESTGYSMLPLRSHHEHREIDWEWLAIHDAVT